MALDIKTKKGEAAAVKPVDGDERDIQYLLNAFLIFNVIQLCAIVGLARLDRKQKHAATRRMNALLPPIIEEDDEPLLDTTPPVKEPVDEDAWHRQDPSSPAAQQKSLPGTVRSLRGVPSASTAVADEASIPLLRSPSQASSVRNSRYLAAGLVPASTSGKTFRTKREVKRGEVFAIICGLWIAFAWILFMGTAWLRLRSKEERGTFTQH